MIPENEKEIKLNKKQIAEEISSLFEDKVKKLLDQLEHANKEMIDLKKEKLEAEISNLNKKSYKKIEFWNLLSTTMIAGLTVAVLYFNGAFDAQSKLLASKVLDYKNDTAALNQQKKMLANELDSFKLAKKLDSTSAVFYQKQTELLQANFHSVFDSLLKIKNKQKFDSIYKK